MDQNTPEISILLRSLIKHSSEAVVFADLNGEIKFTNTAADQLYGYQPNELLGQNVDIFNSNLTHNTDEIVNSIKEIGQWTGELIQRCKDNSTFYSALTVSLIFNDQKQPIGFGSHSHDISIRKQNEARIQHLAHHDPLTNMPNRSLLTDRIEQCIISSRKSNIYNALIYLDLDRFKAINDGRGHPVGDQLLIEVAKRILSCLQEKDTAARMGGDEFTIILKNLHTDKEKAANMAEIIAEQIHKAISAPIQLEEQQTRITPSIGINLFQGTNETVENIIKHTDTAMLRAKENGRDQIQFFMPRMQEKITHRLKIEQELNKALLSEELVLHYQPVLNFENKIQSVEALIRWQKDDTLILPRQFIDIAEFSGQILKIGEYVLKSAMQFQCSNLKSICTDGCTSIAINISPNQFKQPDFVEQCKNILKQYNCTGNHFIFEITENVLIEDIQDTIKKMNLLKDIGVRFYIDDFGTGYSSLTYLQKLPLDGLKIDRSFVSTLSQDHENNSIVRLILDMAHSLGLKSIAEGIETKEQFQMLKEYGCQLYQGFYFSKAVSAEKILELYKSQSKII